ncbi:MAG: hypothetical protein ABI467_23445 [Kofleriaceae bacterium]
MPVIVHVPIKLRISAHDLGGVVEQVESAVAAATMRALKRSCEAVVDPRGGYEEVCTHTPTFRWRGAPVTKNVRAALEVAIASSIEDAIASSGIRKYDELRRRAPALLPDLAGEPIDRMRYDEELGLYWIPSYDATGKPTKPVKVKQQPKPPATEPQARVLANFHAFGSEADQDFIDAFGYHVADHFAERTVPDVFGVLYRIASLESPVLSIWERGKRTWRMHGLQLGTLHGGTYAPLDLTKLGDYSWERIADPVQALKQWREGNIKSRVAKLKGVTVRRGEGNAQQEAAEAKAKEETAAYTLDWEHTRPAFYKFSYPGGFVNYPIRTERVPQMPPSGYCVIVPLATPIQIDENADATTERGGTGGRTHLGTLGDLPGEGGVGGETIYALTYGAAGASKFAYKPQPRDPLALPGWSPVCEPWMGEPPVGAYGARGAELAAMIEEIAKILEMDTCPYPMNFAVNAAKQLGGLAGGIGSALTMADISDFIEDLEVGVVENGEFSWKPIPSTAIAELRRLANVVPLLEKLEKKIEDVVWPNLPLMACGYFKNDFDYAMESDVVWIYLFTCQIALLQLLASSARNIQERLDEKNIANYAEMAKILLSTVATDQVELVRLRDALKKFTDRGNYLLPPERDQLMARDPGFALPEAKNLLDAIGEGRLVDELDSARKTVGTYFENEWNMAARADLRFRVEDLDGFVRGFAGAVSKTGWIENNSNGLLAITDHSGKTWTLTELNAAISARQEFIETTDPIIQHMRFSEDVPGLVRHPERTKDYLRDLLTKLLAKNGEIRSDVIADAKWAFEHSKLELPKGSTDYFGNQSGLHAAADLMIRDAFGDAQWRYYRSLEHLYRHQVGYVSLRDTFLFVGIIALSILMPPVGAVLGIAEAAWRYHEAKEMLSFYDAIWDERSTGIVNRAEVEAQMFVAKIGLVLSFIPAVGEVTSLASRGIKEVVKKGLTEGAEAALKGYLEHVAEEVAKKLGPGLVKELAMLPVMNKVFEAMIDPMVDDLIHRIEIGTDVAVSDAEKAFYDGQDSDELVDPEDDE